MIESSVKTHARRDRLTARFVCCANIRSVTSSGHAFTAHPLNLQVSCSYPLSNYLKMTQMPSNVIPTKIGLSSNGVQPLAWMIPVKTGIQDLGLSLDPGFRRGDGVNQF